MKNEKGITLIALIITIIVMIILVGVSVSVALQGGIFEETRNASTSTEEKAIYDQIVSAMALTDNGKINVKGTYDAVSGMLTITKSNPSEVTERTKQVTLEVTGKKGTYKYTITGEKIILGETLDVTWPDDLITATVGSIIEASNGEEFYVIGYTDDTVTLLAVKNVNTSTNKQADDANTVAFGSTDSYETSNIKGLVETYVTKKLGLDANCGRLMTKKEAEDLAKEDSDKLYYHGSAKLNYWLNAGSGFGWVNTIEEGQLNEEDPKSEGYCGIRPVIEIPRSLFEDI